MKASLALAALACAIGAAWMTQGVRGAGEPTAHAITDHAASAPVIALPAGATIQSPQPFRIDAAIARDAVRDGMLRIALPDGREHAIAIERHYTDSTGHWNVVGRAPTSLGEQPMVLTFGAKSVFGTLPMPDARMMRIATNKRGGIEIAPAGGLVPQGARTPPDAPRTDALFPSQETSALASVSNTQHTPTPAVAPRTSASVPMRVDGASAAAPSLASPAAAPIDTTPVQIDVLAVYTQEQLSLRGTQEAVEAEFANLIAVANQAHIDSGSRVRLNVVQMREHGEWMPGSNLSVLQNASGNFEDARNAVGADIVTILRPHFDDDWTCGIAYLPNLPLWRTRTLSTFGYGVVNDDGPCGPLVTAHEIGHNLGAMHDRETDGDRMGQVEQGAFWFSFGYHGKNFSTIMAYEDSAKPWVPYFSNPASNKCNAQACGVADYADDVRNYNLMAPAIAAFRGAPGTIAIPDTEFVEPTYADAYVWVEVRLTGRAPAGGYVLQFETSGTATLGEDYAFEFDNNALVIPEGSNSATVYLRLLPDAVQEGDETIALHISSIGGAPIADADATFTLVESPRQAITGRLWFPEGASPPSEPIAMRVEGLDGANTEPVVTLVPPQFAYALDVPYGTQAVFRPALPEPWATHPLHIKEARQSRHWYMFPEQGVRVTGTVSAQPGMVLPESVNLTFVMVRDGGFTVDYDYALAQAPDYTFSKLIAPGVDLTIDYQNPSATEGNAVPFTRMMVTDWNLRADAHHDIVLGTRPSLRAWHDRRSPMVIGGLPVYLSSPAPPGGVSMRCRTANGTAKAGLDFVAMEGTLTIPEGEWGPHYCGDLVVLRDGERHPEHLYLVLDQVTGADLTTPSAEVVLYWNELGPMVTGGRNPPKRP